MSEEQLSAKDMSAPKTPDQVPPKNDSYKIPPKEKPSPRQRLLNWRLNNKELGIPALVILLIIILGLVPYTRFKITGLVIKNNITLRVMDATAGTPVSGATVSSGSIKAQTDGDGKVTLRGVKVGHRMFYLSKNYYQSQQVSELVPLRRAKTTPQVSLNATGRQVELSVTNLITKQPLSNVQIQIADITAKTDKNGNALLVLPASLGNVKTELSLDGYNQNTVYTGLSSTSIEHNSFTLTPTGKVYFLSKLKGTMDLMKANLDGTSTETVLPGTGTEVTGRTAISQSPDGKFVALVTQRNASDPGPQLYILSTSDDKLLGLDSGNAIFTLRGWAGDNLVYTSQRQDLPNWQTGTNRLKSYDATSGKVTVLDQSSASGDSTASISENYSLAITYSNNVIYAKSWNQAGDSLASANLLATKQNTLAVIGANGQNQKVAATYPAADSVQYGQHGAEGLYVWDGSPPNADKFYDFNLASGGIKQISSITSSDFYQDGLAFYYSASGNQAAWNEYRNGQETLVVSDNTGANQQVINGSASDTVAGWLGDQYILLSYNNSTLFVIGTKGSNPIKVADYQSTSFY